MHKDGSALEYLYSRQGVKLGLENMERMSALLGHPERSFRSVHVAGTNGKGSTVALLDSILRKDDRHVGRLTSPHLSRFKERIAVDGVEIADEDIERLVRELRAVVEREDIDATYFELVTMMAFLHFARQGIEYAILETGMGGRLDATNIVEPDVSIITSIAKDHERFLGSTLGEIAGEKGGIIKDRVPVFVADQSEQVLSVLRRIARERDAPFTVVPKDDTLQVSLAGAHQVENASLASAAAGWMGVPADAIREGLERTVWPGRLQTLSADPLVIADGAHNPASLQALQESLPDGLRTLVFAVSEHRDYEEMLAAIAPGFERIIITRTSFKPEDPGPVSDAARRYADVVVEEDVGRAVALALEKPGVLITGSLYMLGDAMRAVRRML